MITKHKKDWKILTS